MALGPTAPMKEGRTAHDHACRDASSSPQPGHDGVISQFEGYEDFEVLDWQDSGAGTGTSGGST